LYRQELRWDNVLLCSLIINSLLKLHRFGSNGTFSFWRDAAEHGYLTMDWIAKQKWSNQKIYSYGISADGIAATLQPVYNPKWLKGQCLMVASDNVHSSSFQNGAYRQGLIDGWLNGIKEPSYIPIVRAHEVLTDFWNTTSLVNSQKNIRWPSLHISGWWDIFQDATLHSYAIHEQQNPFTYLMFNPWGHCTAKKAQVNYPNAEKHGSPVICFDFFKHIDQVSEKDLEEGKISPFWIGNIHYKLKTFYVMGPADASSSDDGNYWVTMDKFLATTPLSLYISPNHTLDSKPVNDRATVGMPFVYNPANPTPTLGGPNLALPTCGAWDQSSIEARQDVLVFTSEAANERTALLGKITATLFVSSNASDTDFVVRITDVYPNGKSMLIGDGIQRMKWRNGPVTPEPLTADTIYMISIDMWSTAYIVNKGHKVRISITSSNYPRFSRNPNNGELLVPGDSGPLVIAKNTIFVGGQYQSKLELPIVNIQELQAARL